MTDSSNPIRDAALAYASHGIAVLPVRAGSKVPLTSRGVKDATTNEAAIRGWWQKWPDANVAIACGAASRSLPAASPGQDEPATEPGRGRELLPSFRAFCRIEGIPGDRT